MARITDTDSCNCLGIHAFHMLSFQGKVQISLAETLYRKKINSIPLEQLHFNSLTTLFYFCLDLLWQSSVWDTNHRQQTDSQRRRRQAKNHAQLYGKLLSLQYSKELEYAEGLLNGSSFTDRHTSFCITHSKLTVSAWCQHHVYKACFITMLSHH